MGGKLNQKVDLLYLVYSISFNIMPYFILLI